MTRTKLNVEVATPFYNVDMKSRTFRYLAKKEGSWYEVVIPFDEIHLSVQKGGNMKTGKEWLLNTLPGEHYIEAGGNAITNVHGSCVGCCDGCESFCYAINGTRQHHNSVMPSVIKNLVLYRTDPQRFEDELNAILDSWPDEKQKSDDGAKQEEKVFRWHSSGEIESPEYLEMMMRVAEKHPDVHFYSYTKRFDWLSAYLDIHHDFPKNFVWNLSVWGDNLKKFHFNPAYLSKVQCFEWKDEISIEDYNHSIHCPAVIHDGKKLGHLDHNMTCKKCGMCWKGKLLGKTIIVFNH